MKVDHYEHGVPSWVDLSTGDLDAAIGFYSALFGWTAEDAGEAAGHYHLCYSAGEQVAGIGPQMFPGPAHWTTYVNVTSADDAVARVPKAGGTVLVPPMDVMDSGRMAIAADPAGAAIGIWQPNQHIGATLVNEPVSYTWSQLLSTDLEKVAPFYAETFDWGIGSDEETGGKTFTVGGRAVCGAMPMPKEAPAGTPSYWDVYFAVKDADATAKQAVELGGTILMGPEDMSAGRICSAMDAGGVAFGFAAVAPQ